MTKLNQNASTLLAAISDGQIHSGEVLGNILGVSRAAVWKQLQQFEKYGVAVETVKGQGYRIEGGLDLLNQQVIFNYLPELVRGLVTELVLEPVLPSTNQELLDRVRENRPAHGVVYLAEMQTAGRGRRGRDWQSPFARNIYLSLAWKFEQGIAAVEGLSLAVGVAVLRALTTLGAAEVGLKWPNDLMVGEKKLGGVLVEIAGDVSGECYVIIGLGLNVNMPDAAATKIDQGWTDLARIGVYRREKMNRSILIGEILRHLLPMVAGFEKTGFSPIKKEWEAANIHQGQLVDIVTAAETVSGTALGVTDSGALRMQVDGKEQVFVGGEVSVRRTA